MRDPLTDDVATGPASADDGAPAEVANATEQAVDALRGMIIRQQLSPEQQVRQEEIAEALGISRSPIREALRTLENEGFVRHVPRRGYFVKRFSVQELEQIYLMRRVLETELILSARLPDQDDIALLRSANERIGGTPSISEVLAANRELHFAIFNLSPLQLVVREVERLWNLSESYRAAYLWAPETRMRIVREHDEMIDALAADDRTRFVQLADRHREAARKMVVDLMR